MSPLSRFRPTFAALANPALRNRKVKFEQKPCVFSVELVSKRSQNYDEQRENEAVAREWRRFYEDGVVLNRVRI